MRARDGTFIKQICKKNTGNELVKYFIKFTVKYLASPIETARDSELKIGNLDKLYLTGPHTKCNSLTLLAFMYQVVLP